MIRNYMVTHASLDLFKVEEDIQNLEQENSHGNMDKMQLVFQKRSELYKRYSRVWIESIY